VTTFAATSIDDLILLTLFFAHRIPARRIVAGQYLGFGAIIVVTLIAIYFVLSFPHNWIRVLGLLPVGIDLAPKGIVGKHYCTHLHQIREPASLLNILVGAKSVPSVRARLRVCRENKVHDLFRRHSTTFEASIHRSDTHPVQP
jgi:hypothetical protein